MEITQANFSGGMVALFDATKTPPNAYRIGLNCRIRENAIVGAFKPVRISTPNEIHQAVFAFDEQLIAVIGGGIYKLDGTSMTLLVNAPIMSTTADTIWHELVPAPTNFFMKQGAATETYNSVVSAYPEAAVLQDGVGRPVLLNANLAARYAQTYSEWQWSAPEYVPIGKQMASSGNKLYIASPDGKRIYQSVSGRQLDFVLNIDNDGAKQGDAETTYLAVSAARLSALVPAQGSGFLAFTQYQAFAGLPDGNFPEIFGEPYIRSDTLFPVGAVSQTAFTFSNGESVFVSSAGIQMFNQVMQQQRQSNNTPMGAPILTLLNRPLTRVACCTVDDYVLFGVSTIYGDGILVFDNLVNQFVSIDLVGTVKEFALLRIPGSTRVFFTTTANELFEMPLYAGERSTFAVYFGEYSSQASNVQLKPEAVRIGLTNVRTSGDITIRTITDKSVSSINVIGITATTPTANILATSPQLFTTGAATQNVPITAHLTDTTFGFAVGVEVSCSADARLVSIVSDFSEQTVARPVAVEDTQVDKEPQVFLALGNIEGDTVTRGECKMSAVRGRQYIAFQEGSSIAEVQNGDQLIRVQPYAAKVFNARSDMLYMDTSVTIYDFATPKRLLDRRTAKTPNEASKFALLILGNVGAEQYHAPYWALFEGQGVPIVATAGTLEYTSDALLKNYMAHSNRPLVSLYSTDYVDFYILNVDPGNADHTSPTGEIANWVTAQITSRNNGKFNVVMLGTPIYSATNSYEPGNAALQSWNFRRMGVDLVLSSGAAYERYVYNGVYYINVGTGRASGLEETTAGVAVPGILQLSAMPTILAAEFYDIDGNTRDRIAIVG